MCQVPAGGIPGKRREEPGGLGEPPTAHTGTGGGHQVELNICVFVFVFVYICTCIFIILDYGDSQYQIRELEEREMYFSEQLHLLEMGVRISGW